MKLRKNIVCHIVVSALTGHYSVKKLYTSVHSSGSACIYDSICLKGICENLGGNGGIDFAYTAVYSDDFTAAEAAAVKFKKTFLNSFSSVSLAQMIPME